MNTIEQYHALVKENFPNIDIGLLVLNAGVMQHGVPFELNTDQEAESTLAVNGLHVVYLSKVLVKRLMQREKRAGLIIVSSGLARVGAPGVATYCGTKALVSAFGTGIHYELKDWVDVLVWEAGPGQTNLGQGEQPPAAICRPVPEMIEGCLLDLGRQVVTAGVFKHHMMNMTIGMSSGMFKKKMAEKRAQAALQK